MSLMGYTEQDIEKWREALVRATFGSPTPDDRVMLGDLDEFLSGLVEEGRI